MLSRFKLKTRLVIAFTGLALLIIALSAYGIDGMRSVNEAMRSARIQVGASNAMDQLQHAHLSLLMMSSMSDATGGDIQAVNDELRKERQAWDRLQKLALPTSQTTLALALERARLRLYDEGLGPLLTAQRHGDSDLARQIAHQQILPLYDRGFRPALTALMDDQATKMTLAYSNSQRDFATRCAVCAALLIANLLLGGGLCWWLARADLHQLSRSKYFPSTMACNDANTTLAAYPHDENERLQDALTAMNASVARLVAGLGAEVTTQSALKSKGSEE